MNFIKRIKSKFHKANRSEKGFSLLEMLVSMVIFLIVTGSVYGLLSMGRTSRNRSSRRTDVLKNARTAIHLIGRDALNAGLGYHQKGAMVPDDFLSSTLGLPPDVDNDRDILTSVIAGNDLFPNDLTDTTSDRTDLIAFAYRDIDFNGGDALSISGTSAGGAPETGRLGIAGNAANSAGLYDLILVEAGSTQFATMVSGVPDNSNIDFTPSDPLSLNLPYNVNSPAGSLMQPCTVAITENCNDGLTSAKRFFWTSYKVKQDGTLVRIIYGNNRGNPFDQQIQEQPLAYNVKDLQFRYVLVDGTVTNNPAAGPDGLPGTADDLPNNYNLIRQITVSITVQSTEVDEQTGLPEIITLDATFSARNLEYDAG